MSANTRNGSTLTRDTRPPATLGGRTRPRSVSLPQTRAGSTKVWVERVEAVETARRTQVWVRDELKLLQVSAVESETRRRIRANRSWLRRLLPSLRLSIDYKRVLNDLYDTHGIDSLRAQTTALRALDRAAAEVLAAAQGDRGMVIEVTRDTARCLGLPSAVDRMY